MSFGVSQPTASTKRPYNINDAETSTNQDNIPVLYGAGVFKATVDWVATLYNLTSKNVKSAGDGKGKASSSSGQKDWYADIAGITNICPDDAPNDAILFILVNDEVAFTGPLSRAPGTYYASFSIPKYGPSCRFYWGMKDQPADTLVLFPRQDAVPSGVDPRDISTWPRLNSSGDPVDNVTELPGIANPLSGHYDFHPPYRNQGLFVAKQFYLGSSPNAPTVVFVLARGTKFFSGARFEAGETGVNPMGPQYEILHDDLFGCGLPDSKLDATSFTNTATALTTAGMFLSPVLINPSSGRSIFTNYFLYFDGFLRRNGSIIEAGYFSHGDIDVPGLPDVGSDDLVGEPNIKPGNLADTKNCFFVAYTNRAKWWKDDDTERYIDQANFLKVGRQREDRLERQFIIDGDIAVRHGVEWGKIFALEPVNGDASFTRERVAARRIGDRFKTDVASLALSYVWRITKAEWPSDRDGTVKFTFENERGIWPTLFIPPPALKPPDFIIKPAAITNARIVELPSGELKDSAGLQIAILAQRASTDILGFKIYVSLDNTTFDLAGTQHHFAAFGKVRSAAYSSATADVDTAVGMIVDLLDIDLGIVADSSQTDQQRDDRNLLSFVDNEIMSVGGVTALGAGREKIFQRRALYGTAKATHFVDANCWFIFRDWIDAIASRNFAPGVTCYFKLVPFIYGGDYDISLVGSIAHNFAGGGVGSIVGLQLTTSARVAAGQIESRIAASWDYVRDQDIAAFTVAIKRTSEPDVDASWQTRSSGLEAFTDWPVAPSTSYDVKVRPINSLGAPGAWSAPVTIVSASISPFKITGVELRGQGNDNICRERDFKFDCRLNSPSSNPQIGGSLGPGNQDPALDYILWQIFVGNVNIYEEKTTAPHFDFTESKNEAASALAGLASKAGGALLPLTLEVFAVDTFGNFSAPFIGPFQNIAPVAPGNFQAFAADNRTVLLTWINGPETDRESTEVYRNTANNPSTAALIGTIGQDANYFIDVPLGLSGSVPLFYWLKAVDTFQNKSPFTPVAEVTSGPLVAHISDISDFEIDATKLFLNIVILRGDVWSNNTPSAGWIAVNDHEIIYKGVRYPITGGFTNKKYVSWNVGDATYTVSDTQPALSSTTFFIAQNRSGIAVVAWNSFANLVVGSANIIDASILNAHIVNLAVEKILAGIILGQEFILRNDGTAPAAFKSYDYDPGVAGFFLGMDATGQSFLEVFRGLIRCAINIGGVFQVAANGVVTIGPLTIGTDGSFKINAGATSFNVDPDGSMWMGASTFAAAPLRITNAGFMFVQGAEFENPIIQHTLAAPTFINDYDSTALASRNYNDNDTISVRAQGPSGKKIRFTTDGSEVTPSSPYWPDYPTGAGDGVGPANFLGFILTGSGYNGTFRARAVDGPSGEFLGDEATIHFTHVPIDLLPLPAATPPTIAASSGTRGASGYKVKIVSGLSGATIMLSLDGGSTYSAYSATGNYRTSGGVTLPSSNSGQIAMDVNDGLFAYVTKVGYSPSATEAFYNIAIDPSWSDPGWHGPPGTLPP